MHLDAMELQVGATAATGIIGRQGLGELRKLDLNYLWLQSAVRGKQVNLKKVQSESNVEYLGTKVLEKDKIDRHMKNLGCVRFEWWSPGLTVEGVNVHHKMCPIQSCPPSQFPHTCATMSIRNRSHVE